MIREFKTDDIDSVMHIWLYVNMQAHSFISKSYWKDNFDTVKEVLPQAEVYIYEDDSEIHGFIGLTDNYIAGIFVDENMQSKGIGKQLLDYVKGIKSTLILHVYEKNERAVRFYERESFKIQDKKIDEETGEWELLMQWECCLK